MYIDAAADGEDHRMHMFTVQHIHMFFLSQECVERKVDWSCKFGSLNQPSESDSVRTWARTMLEQVWMNWISRLPLRQGIWPCNQWRFKKVSQKKKNIITNHIPTNEVQSFCSGHIPTIYQPYTIYQPRPYTIKRSKIQLPLKKRRKNTGRAVLRRGDLGRQDAIVTGQDNFRDTPMGNSLVVNF